MVVRWVPGARVAVTWDLGEVAVFYKSRRICSNVAVL
jgi:hypothetical protein